MLDLFEYAAARATDPRTSHQAAASLPTSHLEEVVLGALKSHTEGLTSHELARITGLDLVTVSPRLRPLVNKRLVVDSGEKRAGTSGRQSIVWKAI